MVELALGQVYLELPSDMWHCWGSSLPAGYCQTRRTVGTKTGDVKEALSWCKIQASVFGTGLSKGQKMLSQLSISKQKV